METQIHVASVEDILRGATTDVYFLRTVEVLRAAGLSDVVVRAEFHAMSLPRGYRWAVFAGLKEVLHLLRGRPVTVYALPEGTIFREGEPLMIIEGRYVDFAALETAILGILRHYTSVATKAARIKKAAGDKTCLFFGARAVHPAIQPMVDRAAYIGGCDGVANVLGAEMMGVRPVGTMPHALMIIFRAVRGDHTEAWLWFDRALPSDIPRIVLVDTFFDEREEALMAAKLLGEKLAGVRLDTPGSRRGSMRRIVEEVRWTLDIHGYRWVRIFVSGGLDEEQVRELRDLVDGFGVGTAIAFPPSIDISMDVVEVLTSGGWVRITKRGKFPGARQLWLCGDGRRIITLLDGDKPCDGEPMLVKWLEGGRIVRELPGESEIRTRVLEQLRTLE